MESLDNNLKEGEVLFANGKILEAKQHFIALINNGQNCKEAYNNLGVITFQQNDTKSSIEYFTKALETDPLYKDAIMNYADLLRSMNQISIAKPIIEKAAEKYQDDEEIINLLNSINSSEQDQSKIAIVCPPDQEMFLNDIVSFLKTGHEVKACYTTNANEIYSAIEWADIVWLEWANEITITLTNHPKDIFKGKHVICRLHSYEIFLNFVKQINWRNITDILFVAKHIKDIAIQQEPKLSEMVENIYIVPNGIDMNKFTFKKRTRGKAVAFIGELNFKKGPMLLLHALQELVQSDDEYKLFIAGTVADARYELYFEQMTKEMGLEKNVQFDGWIEDINAWLEDKQYIVCSSILEGHPVGIMEAMARGLKPLIHNFVGARGIYPGKYIWTTISDFVRLVESDDYDSSEYRNFIADNFSLQKQLQSIENIINRDNKYQDAVSQTTDHSYEERTTPSKEQDSTPNAKGHARVYPDEAFSSDPEIRIKVLTQEVNKQLSLRRFDIAETTLERLAIMTSYSNDVIIGKLIELYQMRDDIPKIQSIWKRAAVSDMEKNNLDRFLDNCYKSIYSEIIFGKAPNYKYSKTDEDINAFISLSAKAHSLYKWVQKNRKKPEYTETARLKIGIILEGFNQNSAPIRTYFPMAEYYDRNKFEIYFYSRWCLKDENAKKQQHDVTARFFQQKGCHVRTPECQHSPMEQVSFITKQILNDEIDILIFQTSYFVPPYNFISCLQPAFFQARIEHQQPEYSTNFDLDFTMNKAVFESANKTSEFPISQDGPPATTIIKRSDYGIPDNAIILVSSNRNVRYNQKPFWDEVSAMLRKHQNVFFIAIGLSNLDGLLPETCQELKKRIVTPGFRTDVMSFMEISDLYVDIFPSGGGTSLIEAMHAGLPTVSFGSNYSTLFSISDESLAHDYIATEDLVIPYGNTTKWHDTLDRLILDSDWRKKMGKAMVKRSHDYAPDRVVNKFLTILKTAYHEKVLRRS